MKNSYYHPIFEGSNIFQLILTVAKQSRRFSAFSEKKTKQKQQQQQQQQQHTHTQKPDTPIDVENPTY